MYKYVFILSACLLSDCRRRAPTSPQVVNFFYSASFQQLFAYFRHKSSPNHPHYCVYIFYKFASPRLISISRGPFPPPLPAVAFALVVSHHHHHRHRRSLNISPFLFDFVVVVVAVVFVRIFYIFPTFRLMGWGISLGMVASLMCMYVQRKLNPQFSRVTKRAQSDFPWDVAASPGPTTFPIHLCRCVFSQCFLRTL